MLTLVLPTGQLHGWGVCGKWIVREMAQITPTQFLTDLALLQYAGEPHEVELLRRLAVQAPDTPLHLSGPVFMDMFGVELIPPRPNIRGNPTVGYCFFETDTLPPKSVQTARDSFDFILTGSSWCTQVLRAHGLSGVDTLIQGVDTAAFNATAPVTPKFEISDHTSAPSTPRSGISDHAKRDRFVIFSGGKFEFRKGQDLVLRAVQIMQQRHKDVFLVTAWFNHTQHSYQSMVASPYMVHVRAKGDYRAVMAQVLQANGLDLSRVVILGATPNAQMPAVYHQTDIGVFPNRCEGGTNLVLMEYMACGKPVIAAWTSGHRDILTDQNSLILRQQKACTVELAPDVFSTWDESSIEEIVAKLEWAYQNRDAIKSVGAVAGQDLAKRPWSRVARELLGFINAAT